MADPVSIAKMRDAALKRIAASTDQLADELGIDPPVIRDFARDRAYLEADRLNTLADWLETAVAALSAPPKKQEKAEGSDDEKNRARPARKRTA